MKYRKFLEELVKDVNESYKILQSEAYKIDAKNHKELLDLTKNNSHLNFYNMIQSYKNAGKNILRIINLEKDLIKNPNYIKQRKLHENASEQTNYFLLNLNMGIEQTHKFVKYQLGLQGSSKQRIQKELIENNNTKEFGKKLRAYFYEENGSEVINNFRNSLAHDIKTYQVIRHKTNLSKLTHFKINLVGAFSDDELIAEYNQPLTPLPISNTVIPRNPYRCTYSYTLEKVKIPRIENSFQENPAQTKGNQEFEQKIQKIKSRYEKIKHLIQIKPEETILEPSLNLCDFLTGVYRIFPYLSGVIISETINFSKKT